MADLLTVYDDGEANSFIECKICDKRIRGDTNHKIHLTTLQHYRREKTLADKGFIPEPAPLPQWVDIKEYLTYLKLNEPVIGLGDLVQEEDLISNDGSTTMRYRCRLCVVQMELCDMATHVVGRRHRQKYLERYRSDLVTWENNSEKQAGVVARAKAAMVEKQEGWGNPVPLIRSEKGRSVRNQARPSNGKALPGHSRSRPNYNPSHREGDAYRKPSHYNDENQNDQSYRDDVPDNPSGLADNRYDTLYSQDGRQRGPFEERDYTERPYWEDGRNVGTFSSKRTPERQTYLDKGDPQPYDDEWGPGEKPSKRPYENRDGDDFYHGTVSENRFSDPEVDYQDSGRMGGPMYTSHHEAGPSMEERQRQSRNLPYTERERERFQEPDKTGRCGSFEMQDYNKRQRYYSSEDDLPAKKKKRSRFSDASPLELALSKNSQVDAMVSKQKRAVPYMHSQASGSNMDSAVTPLMKNVLDVLNCFQIETVEEANFLKDRLCALLKEFEANKAQRTRGQALHSSADFADARRGINSMEPRREMPQSRRLDDHGFQEPVRYNRDMQGPREYLHTRHVEEDSESMRQSRVPEEPKYQWNPYRESSAGRSEERMGHHPDDRRVFQEPTWNSRAVREEERGFSDKHRYRAGGDLYDPFEPSSSPPLETSNPTLDKLASTLLELVARKVN